MSTKPYYRFRLRNTDTNEDYYIVRLVNVVGSVIGERYLSYAPDGWDGIELKYARNLKYFGLFREFSTQLKFVKDGARILRHLFYQYGSEAKCSLWIDELNSTTLGYEFLAEIELDFSTVEDEKVYFGISSLEGGITAQVKSNENVEYAIPITGADIVPITVPSLRLTGNAKFMTAYPIAAQTSANISGVTSYFRTYINYISKKVSPINNTSFVEPITENNYDFTNAFGSGQYFDINPQAGTLPLGKNYLLHANTELTNVVVKSDQGWFVENNSGTNGAFYCKIYLINILNATPNREDYQSGIGTPIYSLSSAPINTGTSLTFRLDIDTPEFTIPYGWGLVMQYGMYNGATVLNGYNIAWENNNPIDVSFNYYASSFNITGIRGHRLGELLVRKMTDNAGTLVSPMLTGDTAYYGSKPKNLIFLSNDSIVGINSSGYSYPVIKTSWEDFFKAMTCYNDAGMYIQGNNVILNRKDTIFTGSEICNIGSPRKVGIAPATEFNFKTLSIGYEDKEHDLIGAIEEVNTTHLYNFPKIKAKGDLDLVSPYRADIWGIFESWINNSVKKEQKQKSNNDIFMLEIAEWSGTGQAVPYQPTGYIEGVSDTANTFNITLSPKHNFWRCCAYLYSFNYGLDDSIIQFQVGDRNISMISSFGYGYTIENNSPIVSNCAPGYFKPFIFALETNIPSNMIQLIKDVNGIGYISFTYRNRTLRGYVLEAASTPSKSNKQTLRLLSTTANDLSFLEYGK